MANTRAPRGAPAEPEYEVGINPDFWPSGEEHSDYAERQRVRAEHFIEWARRELGIAKCRTVADVARVRAARANGAKAFREVISSIDGALCGLDAQSPDALALGAMLSSVRLRLKKQEGSAPLRAAGSPQRVDASYIEVIRDATGFTFKEMVRSLYSHLSPSVERDRFVELECRSLQATRERRR